MNITSKVKSTALLYLIVAASCAHDKTDQQKVAGQTSNTTSSIVGANPGHALSGRYEDVSLAIQDSLVTGVYEYYDQQDPKTKEFLQASVFYFYGIIANGKAVITAIEPGGDKIVNGQLLLPADDEHALSLKLSENVNGYGDVDFTDDNGFESKLKEKKAWSQVRVVQSKKAFLFDTPGQQAANKSYLISSDIIKVIEQKKGWMKIEYNSPNTDRSLVAWIRSEDLYSLNPATW